VNNKANGQSKKGQHDIPMKDVVLEREEVLELMLLSEKQRRIKAEEARLQAELNEVQKESNALTQKITQKYGVDINGRRVEGDGRVLTAEGEPVRAPVHTANPQQEAAKA
jgi:hypothetical protein